jgi:hypothetical protein
MPLRDTLHAPSIGIIRTGTKGVSQPAGNAVEYPRVGPSIRVLMRVGQGIA